MVVQCGDFGNIGNHAGKLTRVYTSYIESKFTGDERDYLTSQERDEIDACCLQVQEECLKNTILQGKFNHSNHLEVLFLPGSFLRTV